MRVGLVERMDIPCAEATNGLVGRKSIVRGVTLVEEPSIHFDTMTAAAKAGKEALKRFLDRFYRAQRIKPRAGGRGPPMTLDNMRCLQPGPQNAQAGPLLAFGRAGIR